MKEIKMNKILIIVLGLFLFSCKKEIKEGLIVEGENITTVKDTLVLKPISLLKANQYVSDWIEINNFEEELSSVSKAPIRSEKELEQLINLLKRVKETVPDKFKTEAIDARIKIIETEMLMFNQYVKEQNNTDAAKRKLRLQKAYNVLVNQIKALLIKEQDYERYK